MTRVETWDNPELNLELYFCTEVLKLDSLHYGYWEQAEDVDIDSIRQAQKRYTDTLLKMIPEDVHNILDIGCGIGDNARALAAEGYQLTCISPDRNHGFYFKDADPQQIRFINTGIESFASDKEYDLILMSESQGYFPMDMGFSQSIRHLRPGGYLLVSGIFKKDEQEGFEGSHIEKDYLQCARNFNLIRKEYVDITENTLPTLQYAFDNYHNYLEPLTRTIMHFVGKKGQTKINMLKMLFGRELRNFEKVRRYYEERFNPELFRDKMRYTRVLFQYQPALFEQSIIGKLNNKPVVSAIVSAYNEEAGLDNVLSALAGIDQIDEVLCVNDGSKDDTAKVMESFKNNEKIRLFHFDENQGKSNAMVCGALQAHGDVLVFIDADLQNLSAAHIEKLVQPLITNKADMIIGDPRPSGISRYLDPFRALSGERSVWRHDFLPLVNQIRNSGFGVETLLNMAYKENGKKIIFQNLDGLVHPIKLEKEHPIKAGVQYLEEGSQILNAVVNRTYQQSGFSK